MPDPAFAPDQHGRVGGSGLPDPREDLVNGGAVSHEVARTVRLEAEPPVLDDQAALLERVARGHEELFRLGRLLQEVEGAEACGLDRGLHRAVSRQHDDRHVLRALAQQAQGFEAVEAGHLHVQDHEVDLGAFDHLHGLGARRRGLAVEALEFEHHGEGTADGVFVIDDENSGTNGGEFHDCGEEGG